MKRFLVLLAFSLSSLGAMVRTGIEVQSGGDDEDCYYEDGTLYCYRNVWWGPGLYNGVWYGNRFDYDDWHRSHRHNFPHQHFHGGGHGHGHGGGGHGHR